MAHGLAARRRERRVAGNPPPARFPADSPELCYIPQRGPGGGKPVDDIQPIKAWFYWVKYSPDGRWEPAEFDGVTWLIGDGTGVDLYVIGPRIREPVH